jgi:hypothetical protein
MSKGIGYRGLPRKSVEGWDWFKTPAKPKPLAAVRPDLADEPISLACFDAFERRQITAWRRVGRPDVQSLEELDAAVSSWNEWEARGWPMR